MADVEMNREFVEVLQLCVRQLEAERAGLRAEILRHSEEREIAIDKYGANCFVKRPKPVVSAPISPSMCMILVGFSPTT